MLDNKKIQEIEAAVQRYLREGAIIKEKQKKLIPFFLKNAKNSLDTARLIHEVSSNKEMQEQLNFPNYNGYLWVINASYYSMFYITRALLASEGISIKTSQSVHTITYHALVNFFYATGKLQQKLIQDYEDASTEATQLLGKEKAEQLLASYYQEKDKRSTFTYELGQEAMQNKAQTSLKRAIKYNEELRKILEA